MICAHISEMIGFECHPLSDDGSVAMIDTPFQFADGDRIPVFVERMARHVRFFDDGNVIMHFRGRGVSIEDRRQTRFLRTLADANGARLNDAGEIEVWALADEAPSAFARYMSAMLAVRGWEDEQEGTFTDASLFLDEVTMCLRAWKTGAAIRAGKEYTGISGHVYKMDIDFDGQPVLAIGTHSATVSAAAKKLLDIHAAVDNAGINILVIMDDRHDASLAKREGLILESVATVLMMTKLENHAKANTTAS